MTAIATARTSHVHENINTIELALKSGWRSAAILRPDQVLCGSALLQLGNQYVCVRLVINTGEDTGPLLELVQRDVLGQSQFLETYIILAGHPMTAIADYRARFAAVKTHRVTVGSPDAYRLWLRDRLGPLAKLPPTSSVRRLTEHMLAVSYRPEPTKKRPLVGDYRGYKNRESYEKGREGTRAIETLFSYTLGSHTAILNVEKDPEYQKQDVDFLIQTESGQPAIKLDGKREGYPKNISLEDKSNLWANIDGWFRNPETAMDVLGTLLAPTGELFLVDYPELKAWALENERIFVKKEGHADGQPHPSWVWLVPGNLLLSELTGVARLRIQDWMPTLYAGTYKRSHVYKHLLHRTLVPQERLLVPSNN
jgi:hypothetical protein